MNSVASKNVSFSFYASDLFVLMKIKLLQLWIVENGCYICRGSAEAAFLTKTTFNSQMKAYPKGKGILCFVLLLMMLWQPAHVAAQITAFAPVENDAQTLRQLHSKYEALHKETLASFPVKYKKDYEEVAQQRWDFIKALFDKGEIYTSPAAQAYMDALVNEIVQANPELKNKKFNCYFSRSGVPNAAYMGMGIIVFNLGLFQQVQNESQAAFIICHEIAHYLLQHSEKSIQDYVTTLNSAEVQKELQQIKGARYGKREQLEALLKDLTFDRRRHSRGHELEADSLAVVLMQPTRFDASEALTALALLDAIDQDTFDSKTALQQLFASPAYPFKKRWLAKEEGLLGGHAVLNEDARLADSLKTHPDCSKRIAYLTPKTAQQKGAVQKNPLNEATFSALRQAAAYEQIVFAYQTRNYTRSLYQSLKLLKQQADDPFLVAHVGNILNGFYKAQKAHELSRYIDLPSPVFSPSYNQLLQFVQNLYVEDFAAISMHFLQPYQSRYQAYAPFAEAYRTSRQLAQQ